MSETNDTGNRGYNLIEVLVAMALLSTVLLTVVTLFYLARGNINSGTKMTSAIAVNTRVMEDLSTLSIPAIFTSLSITPTTPLEVQTVQPATMPESSYAGSIMRTTRNVQTAGGCTAAPIIVIANDPQSFLRRWYCQMMTRNNELPSGSVTLILTPRNPSPAAQPLTPATATTLRIRSIVRWREGMRWRQVIVDQTKTRRL